MPGSVHLDPSKRYYISVLPGDAGDPFPATVTPPDCSSTTGANPGDLGCGHAMSGAPIPPACNVLVGRVHSYQYRRLRTRNGAVGAHSASYRQTLTDRV